MLGRIFFVLHRRPREAGNNKNANLRYLPRHAADAALDPPERRQRTRRTREGTKNEHRDETDVLWMTANAHQCLCATNSMDDGLIVVNEEAVTSL
jgi:hypothetical protein